MDFNKHTWKGRIKAAIFVAAAYVVIRVGRVLRWIKRKMKRGS